jgi:hypothetical protein
LCFQIQLVPLRRGPKENFWRPWEANSGKGAGLEGHEQTDGADDMAWCNAAPNPVGLYKSNSVDRKRLRFNP